MEAYSKEFRRDVLAACDAGEGTRSVALRFNVSESWVRRIKQERREQGKLAPKITRTRRKAWEPYADWILAQLDRQPDMYLRELQAAALAELSWQVSDVTLKRGVVKSDDLWQWIEDVRRTGVAAKRTVVIRLRDETGQDVQAWTLNGAFPLKYTGPTLAAKGGGDVAMEELVLSAEGLEFAQLG